MSSKKTIEQPLQISVRNDMNSTKKAIHEQKNTKSIHSWPNNFGNPFANVSVKAQYKKTSIENLKHSTKNFILITEAFLPTKTVKWRRSCNQFPSFMSEPNLSTRSKICMHLKKFKFFSSHPRAETHFSHVQGHQLSSALTGSHNFFHSTIFTVCKKTHLKTFNTKLGKHPI